MEMVIILILLFVWVFLFIVAIESQKASFIDWVGYAGVLLCLSAIGLALWPTVKILMERMV